MWSFDCWGVSTNPKLFKGQLYLFKTPQRFQHAAKFENHCYESCHKGRIDNSWLTCVKTNRERGKTMTLRFLTWMKLERDASWGNFIYTVLYLCSVTSKWKHPTDA